MNTIIIMIFLTLIFGMTLLILKRFNLNSLLFFVGTIGSFLICIYILRNPIEEIIKYYLMYAINYAARYMNYLDVYEKASVVIMNSKNENISVFINYECFATVEHVVYTALVLFFPFINKVRSIIYIIAGNIYILTANVMRILVIAVIVNVKGIEYYDTAHMIVGRIVFFIFIIILYFLVFTRTHIRNQKIGGRR